MKQIFLLFIIIGCVTDAIAQVGSYGMTLQKKIDGKIYKLDKNSIVKDSTGKQVPFDEWSSKIMSGKHDLTTLPLNNEKSIQEYLLITLSAEQKKINDEKNNASKQQRDANPIIAGLPLADFHVKDIDGSSFSTQELKGKIILMNFWFINCKPCVAEIPELNKLVDKFRGKEILFIAPTKVDERAALQHFLKEKNFRFNIIEATEALKIPFIESIMAYPSYILIGKDGVVRYYSTGYSDDTIENLTKILTRETSG